MQKVKSWLGLLKIKTSTLTAWTHSMWFSSVLGLLCMVWIYKFLVFKFKTNFVKKRGDISEVILSGYKAYKKS